ncbi:orotidine-5'-phosphate decarboxylase [bacterium]|nr:MAG: orotidine-5'-phosphate decarboxylase [bacterium]
MNNAGLQLLHAQKIQGTNLCVGLDPHYEVNGTYNEAFYSQFSSGSWTPFDELTDAVGDFLFSEAPSFGEVTIARQEHRTIGFLVGVTEYFKRAILAAWKSGIRVFKPQSSFYEVYGPFGPLVLMTLVHYIRSLADEAGHPSFILLDAKRGDIDSTQTRYYQAYLAGRDEEIIPGMPGPFGFDSMTVTTWMGEDVLTPGLPFFKNGKGATVVTRSSNPSGTTLQDLVATTNPFVALNDKQAKFRFDGASMGEIENLVMRTPTPAVHEVMLYVTEQFSAKHELNQNGISPIFSVMGSTVKMDTTFRKLRPTGLALVPGFGAQGGKFENVMPLVIRDGPHKGHVGLFAASRASNYAWTKEYGGSGDPANMDEDMARAIDKFRRNEKQAYTDAGLYYPY